MSEANSDSSTVDQVNRQKRLMNLELFEVDTKDGGKDHKILITAKSGNMMLSFDTTFDKIRKFFTEKRAKGEKARLKTLP